MASNIDPTLPADTAPADKADLRANLLAAKTEIEALQALQEALVAAGLVMTAVKTGAYQAVARDLIPTDSSGGAFAVTLPATPTHGDPVAVLDVSDSWPTDSVTVARNGQNIEGAAADLVLQGGRMCILRFVTGFGWKIAMLLATSAGYTPGGTDVAVADGGTGASDASGARTNLGLAIGSDVQAWGAQLDTWATVTPSPNGQSLVAAANYAAMRGLLDLESGTDFYSISAANAAFLAAAGVGLVEQITGHIETAADKTYVLDQAAAYAYTINTLIIDASGGTCTAKLTIDGVDVTGISAVSVSTTEATGTASAANSVAVGNTVALVISANSAALNVTFTVKTTRA